MENIKHIEKVLIPDNFLLIEDISKKTTESGIYLPESIKKEGIQFRGKVIGRGAKVKEEGKISLGDVTFMLTDFNPIGFDFNGKIYIIVHRDHIKMVVSKDNYNEEV